MLRPERLFKVTNRNGENAARGRSASTLSLGVRLDLKGSDFYARRLFLIFIFYLFLFSFVQETNRALELISIPLDVEFSRKLLRKALDKTYYSSRSIIECRKMLAFYIYKQQQELAKDFLIFTPITGRAEQHEHQLLSKKEPTSTLRYRPLTAGEPMDFSPLLNNKIDTSPSAQITKQSVIEAYQTLSSERKLVKYIDNK